MSNPNEIVSRIAPALTELDSLIAAAGMPAAGSSDRDTDVGGRLNPARSLPDLALATRAISGWYQNALGYRLDCPVIEAGRALNLDDIVRQHVAMRQEWEQREAVSLAASLTKLYSRAPVVVVPAPAAVAAPGVARRTALLIDDSSDILITVGAFLEAFGFVVNVASNSETALQILAATPTDLLVTDHAMPGMTGKDLAMEALQQNPALRAMIITGYPDLHELRELPPSVMVLAKPFRRAELFVRLRALFERPGPGRDSEVFCERNLHADGVIGRQNVVPAFAGTYC